MLIALSNRGGRIVDADAQAGAQLLQKTSTSMAILGSLMAVK